MYIAERAQPTVHTLQVKTTPSYMAQGPKLSLTPPLCGAWEGLNLCVWQIVFTPRIHNTHHAHWVSQSHRCPAPEEASQR